MPHAPRGATRPSPPACLDPLMGGAMNDATHPHMLPFGMQGEPQQPRLPESCGVLAQIVGGLWLAA
eukprot:scaffold186198_cov31-Tisochrysis_lutea.AAC.2